MSAEDDVAEKREEAVSQAVSVGTKRARSGIAGFDELTKGGLIRNGAYLTAGSAGTGKTIFSMQFIHSGVVKYGENGVYVTLEETPEQLRRDMFSFGWNLKKLENEGKLILLDASSSRIGLGSKEKFVVPRPFTLDALLYEVNRCIEKIKARRVVIDCLDAMSLHAKDVEEFRKSLLKLIMILKSFECTSLLISESFDGKAPSRYGVEEFVTDGIIMLEDDRRVRKIKVLKMRGTDHPSKIVPFQIGENGIAVLSEYELEKTISKSVLDITSKDLQHIMQVDIIEELGGDSKITNEEVQRIRRKLLSWIDEKAEGEALQLTEEAKASLMHIIALVMKKTNDLLKAEELNLKVRG